MPEFKALLDGYSRFRTGAYQEQRRRYDALADKGQAPGVLVISCSDSRVDPTRIFDTEPGQMFVVRNVANLVPPCDRDNAQHSTSAAIEYAVTQLKVHHVVVLGHARCGGIKASLEGTFDDAAVGEGGFIDRWMSLIAPARDTIRAAALISPDIDACAALELAAIRLSLANLRTFPFVAEAEAAGTLKLHGALFDIAEGVLKVLSAETGKFEPITVEWTDTAS
ncbi:carbonic anhydrase [Sandarakinorhabdus sp.]|uniref:carbonic anhydrase n=1 Tax=Sandarakinorhabdus sp. TaxID=1916663 RepID=UPI00333F1E22